MSMDWEAVEHWERSDPDANYWIALARELEDKEVAMTFWTGTILDGDGIEVECDVLGCGGLAVWQEEDGDEQLCEDHLAELQDELAREVWAELAMER